MTGLHTKTVCLPFIAASVLLVTPALAGGADEDASVAPRTVQVQASANAVIVGEDDDHLVEMKLDNGKVTVTIDGEQVPADRIRNEDGRIAILDENGNEMKSLNLFAGSGADYLLALPGGKEGARWRSDAPAPKVMIGVHLADPGPALRKHLKLEPGEGSMISGLYEGLPAERAGLQQYDIIIAVDGKPVTSAKTILDALAKVEAGDDVALSVIQEGRRKEFSVTVDAFDPDRMSPDKLIGGGDGAMIRMAIPNLELAPGEDFDFRQFFVDPDKNDVFVPEGRGFRWRSGDQQELDDRLQHLNDRMEELRKMIDRLVEESKQPDH